MKPIVFRKQISLFVPVADWRAMRREAARQGIAITELCRRWMRPHISRLPAFDAPEQNADSPESADDDADQAA